MRDLEVLMNPNRMVRHLQKPASEFTKYDIIKFIDDHQIEMLNFRYVGEDGKLKTLNLLSNIYGCLTLNMNASEG